MKTNNTIKRTWASLAAIVLLAAGCQSFPGKNNWGIDASIAGAQAGDTLVVSYLKKQGDQPLLSDTILVLSGSHNIRLEKPFVEPSTVYMAFSPKDPQIDPYLIEIFVERPGDRIQVSAQAADISALRTSGGLYDQPDYDTIRRLTDRFIQLSGEYKRALEASDTTSLISLSGQMAGLQNDYFDAALTYIKNNPDEGFSAYMLLNMSGLLPPDTTQALFDAFDQNIKATQYGRQLQAQLFAQRAQKLSQGEPAPDFTLTDLEGKTFSLSDYRGRWVLVDFWGSWCGPCRKGNPDLVRLYNKYRSKGFEIISLAVNDTPEKLRQAIAQDGITWRNVDLSENQTGQTVPMLYNLESIPSKFLIDPQGNIDLIETGYQGENNPLSARLQEIFKK